MKKFIVKKVWFKIVDFYSIFALVCLWSASWILMFPFQTLSSALVYDNFWGAFFSFFGFVNLSSVNVQILPDFVSGILSLFAILILHYRKIISVTNNLTVQEKSEYKIYCLVANLFSILIHTLFFTVVIKIFIFPANGSSDFIFNLKEKFIFTILFCCILSGIVLGEEKISKSLLIIFLFFLIFFNLKSVSKILAVWGFVAILFAECGLYVEFYSNSIKKRFIKNQNKTKFVKNQKNCIIFAVILIFLFFLFPSILCSRVLKFQSGYKGLKWGSSLSDVKSWVKKNSNNSSLKKCDESHFGLLCYKLKLKNPESGELDFLEFQFQNEKLCSVVESFTESELPFEKSEFNIFEKGFNIDSYEKRIKGKKYKFFHNVIPSKFFNISNGTKTCKFYSRLIKSFNGEDEFFAESEKFQLTIKYFSYDYKEFENEELISFRFN